MDNGTKFLIFLILLFGGFIYIRTLENIELKLYQNSTSNFKMKSPKSAEKIPHSVYENTQNNDKLYKIINSDKKMIYFSYANSPVGNSIKRNLQAALDKENLNYNYNFYPDLHSGMTLVRCKNKTNFCAQYYLFDNCGGNVCIIHPKRREVVKIPNDKLTIIISKMVQLKEW